MTSWRYRRGSSRSCAVAWRPRRGRLRRAAKASRAAAVARLDAVRAKKREAAAAGELHGRDGVHNGDGKRSKRTPPTRSRSKKSCFSVKKLRSFLCAAAKA
jgi:hypothetical protein